MHSESAPYNPVEATQRDFVYIAGKILGIASIAFGSIGVLLSFIPLIGIAAIGACIVGAFWGIIGFLILKVGRRGSVRIPTIGILLCAAGIVICIVINVFFIAAAAAASTA